MATFRKKVLKNGDISYTIQVKAKDPLLDKWKTGSMTWRKPPTWNSTQAMRELKKIGFEFEEVFRRKTLGLLADDRDMHFDDYANEYLERQKKNFGVAYYIRQKTCLNKALKFFGHIKLKDITARFVQKYVDELCNEKIIHSTAKLKDGCDLRLVAKANNFKIKKLKRFGAFESLHRGNNITIESAYSICNQLKIEFNDYFDIITTIRPYSKGSVEKFKKFVSQVLKRAKKEGLVEHNFASSDYIEPIKGTTKEIQILNDTEAIKLKQALDNEPNIRWKTAIYIILMMGLRRSELCGLEWKDIDFSTNTITIERACYDVRSNGLLTKDPKTFTSRRTLTMPECLVKVLKEYKKWYDERKSILYETWSKTDRLMINDDGKLIYPANYRLWLKKILKKANLKQVTLHSLRHTNITLQLIAGVDLKTVSTRAGHARTSTTTDIYSHFIRNSDSHASQVLDDIFNKN